MYKYQEMRSYVFTERGQVLFLAVRDKMQHLLTLSGAVRMDAILHSVPGGDDWERMSCVDRLVELGEIREIRQQADYETPGQYRIFVSKKF